MAYEADYAWIIDEEYGVDDDDKRTGPEAIEVIGPRNASEKNLARLKAGHGNAFRLFDDDGFLNLAGRIVYDDPDVVDGFEPLDDYGEGGYGCTRIDFKQGNRWVTL